LFSNQPDTHEYKGYVQGALLAAAILKVEQGQVDQTIGLMSVLTGLPNKQYQAWAFFFLGLLQQTKGAQWKDEATVWGLLLTGVHASTHQRVHLPFLFS